MSKFFDVYEELETLIEQGPEPGKEAVFASEVEAVSRNLAKEAATLTKEEVETEYEESEDFNDEDEIEV